MGSRLSLKAIRIKWVYTTVYTCNFSHVLKHCDTSPWWLNIKPTLTIKYLIFQIHKTRIKLKEAKNNSFLYD